MYVIQQEKYQKFIQHLHCKSTELQNEDLSLDYPLRQTQLYKAYR